MSAIEALYIFDEHNNLIVNHIYTGRPCPPSTLLPLYLHHAPPRPSLLYLPSTNPPTLLHSLIQDNLLFLAPSTTDTPPLAVLEFLHRAADALEEFLGSPLLAAKITTSYDTVAQVLAAIADAGVPCQGEANVLRDVVETGPGVLNNLLGKVGLPGGSAPALPGSSSPSAAMARLQAPQLRPVESAQGSAIPWRRSNVRHTSNELYVDVVETLAVTLAPSGRPLSAFAYGSVAFTSKVSGVPDLLLSLSTGGQGAGMGGRAEQLRRVMQRVVFHPCVRLNRWLGEGVLSFVPPDGRFALCGYEVDLLGDDAPFTTGKTAGHNLNLPATVEVATGLGPTGSDFEVRLLHPSSSSSSANRSPAAASLHSNLGPSSRANYPRPAGLGSDPKGPALEGLTVRVPLPSLVRNISDLRPSKGEAHWSAADGGVEWRVPAKDFGPGGAVLRCSVQGPSAETGVAGGGGLLHGATATTYEYGDEDVSAAYRARRDTEGTSAASGARQGEGGLGRVVGRNRELMPAAATLSFSVKGWLASGLRVESLLVDTKKSRGLGSEVKPYKGVKYLTVSREGVEVRC
ncbi:hypothetical protein LTR08_000733 [Meristemomyces frigidus]|nr:hypothetical protein LTR08_000733 [Meristemomyces frigidus]